MVIRFSCFFAYIFYKCIASCLVIVEAFFHLFDEKCLVEVQDLLDVGEDDLHFLPVLVAQFHVPQRSNVTLHNEGQVLYVSTLRLH